MTGVIEQVPAGPVVAPLAVLAAVAGAAMLVRSGRATPRRVSTVLVTVGYAAAVVTATFFPLQIATGDHGNRVSWLEKANLVPVLTIDVRTFVLNVLLFVPFGVLLQLWRRSTTCADAARWGLVVSAVIEAGQWVTDIVVSSDRTGDVNDLIANTAGAVLGFWALRTTIRARGRHAVSDAWAVAPVTADDHPPATGVNVACGPRPTGPLRSRGTGSGWCRAPRGTSG